MYKKYADSKNLNGEDLMASTKKSSSSVSLVSNHSSNNERTDGFRSKFKQPKFFITRTIPSDFSCDPIKSISDKNLKIYLTHLKIGSSEPQEPTDSSYKLYESFVKTNAKNNT